MARVRGAGGRAEPGGRNSTEPADVVVAVGESRADEPVAGAGAAEDGRGERLRAAVHEEDRPPVTGHDRASSASSERPMVAACQLHGGRSDVPLRASIGSRTAASCPRTHEVAW